MSVGKQIVLNLKLELRFEFKKKSLAVNFKCIAVYISTFTLTLGLVREIDNYVQPGRSIRESDPIGSNVGLVDLGSVTNQHTIIE